MPKKNQSKEAGRSRRSTPPHARRRSHKSGAEPTDADRAVRLTPKRREQPDASTIALCFWLLASRIVEEAEDNGDLECPDPDAHLDGEDGDTS